MRNFRADRSGNRITQRSGLAAVCDISSLPARRGGAIGDPDAPGIVPPIRISPAYCASCDRPRAERAARRKAGRATGRGDLSPLSAFCSGGDSGWSTLHKCAPPIRGRKNRGELWDALREGAIDLVATDHSPCPPEWKRLEEGRFDQAWGGIASLCCAAGDVDRHARAGYQLERLSAGNGGETGRTGTPQ